MPIVELNELMREGRVLAPFPDASTNPLLRAAYGDEAIEAYETLRKGGRALPLRQLAKRFPDMVEEVPSTMMSKSALPGGRFVAASQAGRRGAEALADRASGTGIIDDIVGYTRSAATATNPVVDRAVTELALLDEAKVAVGRRAPMEAKLRGFNYEKAAPLRGKKATLSQVRNVVPKAGKKGAKLLGALPFVGGAVDVLMAGADAYKGVRAVARGEDASEHFQHALAHAGDGAVGLTGFGEILNLGAAVAGHDGVISLVEDALDD